MKSIHHPDFAEQIQTHPHVVADMDEMLLREYILEFHEGKLNEAESAEVTALVQSDPHARSILDGILDAERYGASAKGKAWLDGLLERVIAETPIDRPVDSAPFKETLPDRPDAEADKQSPHAPEPAAPPWKPWRVRTSEMFGLRGKAAGRLAAKTPSEPITGYAGDEDAVFYKMEQVEDQKCTLWLKVTNSDWTKLYVTLGDEFFDEELPQVGRVWITTLTLRHDLSAYQGFTPIITRRP